MSGEQSERHVDDARERPSTFNVRTKSKEFTREFTRRLRARGLEKSTTKRATGATSRTYYRATTSIHRTRAEMFDQEECENQSDDESAIRAGAQPGERDQSWSAA